MIQRVTRASVSIDGEVVGEIGPGLVVLLGIGKDDTEEDARWLAKKVAALRIFADHEGKFNRSILEIGGSALVVSQFTLYGEARKGRRPSFSKAALPEVAEPLCDLFVNFLRAEGLEVATGRFGAMMLVKIHNDGPVTMLVHFLVKDGRG